MNINYCLITLICGSFAFASTASAQDTPKKEQPTTKPAKPAKKKDGEEKKKVGEKSDAEKAEEEKVEAAKKAEAQAAEEALRVAEELKAAEAEKVKAAEEKKAAESAEENTEENGGFSPIAELADKEFVPMKEINEEELEQIIPGRVHPRVDWTGLFRLRTGIRNNFDLDTQGTSAFLPPAESFTPTGNPANAAAEANWSTDLSLRVEPTIFITEDIKIHTELTFLHNMTLGSLSAEGISNDPLRNSAASAGQFSGKASDLFQNLLEINELYGEVNTVFATLYAGRMDDDWGLGMYTGGGDCNDCDYGNHVDRVKLRTNVFGFYITGTWDFPNEGVTTRSPLSFGGLPSDVSQIDEADQWTLSVEKVARTREELEQQSNALLNDNAWIPEGGIQYRYQNQQGDFRTRTGNGTFDPTAPPTLIYRGASVHIVDAWGRLLYQPEEDRYIKINIEAIGAFGSVDNVTDETVGDPENNEALINCFDEDVRNANQERCTTDDSGNSTQRSLTQFGLALESEFRFNSPVAFGLNGGFASGGKSAAWGTQGTTDLNFFRFNPDYRVDLILFTEVIGTITNAYYVNPSVNLRFFETAGRHLEFEVDAIFSGVMDKAGGVASSGFLGLELDAAISYIMRDLFTATIEAGMLFPFDGLAAESGRARYTVFGSNPDDFTSTVSPSIPWTVQGKLNWNF